MARFKRNYLPSQSGPWAKQVEDAIDSTERNLKTVEINNRSKDEQFSASLSRLDGAVIEARSASELADAAQNAAIAANTLATTANSTAITANSTAIAANTAANAANATVIGFSTSGGSTINADNISGGTINGGSLNTLASGGKSVSVSGSSATFLYSGGYVGEIAADSVGRLLVNGNSGLYLGGGASGSTHFGSGGFTVGDGGSLNVQGTITTDGSLTRTILANGGTTTASINNTGNFIRTSSSQRYKTDIQLLDINLNDLYAIEPKTFKRIEEVEESPEGARTYPGFIAEDLAGTSLDHFVFYSEDEEGNSRPEGIHYAELTGALLIAIKDLNARVQALESN